MPIRWDTRNKRWRFEFDRVVEGRRHRLSRLLPRGWSQAQADAYERKAKERADRKALGLKRLELYAHPEDHPAVKEAAAKIARRRMKKETK